MYSNSLSCIGVELEDGDVIPLGPLVAYPSHRHSRSPDTAVSGSYHCDGESTLDIPIYPGLCFIPLGGEVADQALQHGICLWYQKAVE